jgi:hypothetical protein
MILIVCPETGKRVPTGIAMSDEEFARADLQPNVLRCPACGRVHQWTKAQADLRQGPPRRSSVDRVG